MPPLRAEWPLTFTWPKSEKLNIQKEANDIYVKKMHYKIKDNVVL